MAQRDRDADGRPRNARPRDATGRPLPRDRAGVGGPPNAEPDTDLDPQTGLDPHATLDQAQRLLDADRPFHAHEVLEAAWKVAADHERALWRGLAQLAVGLTHAQRGNASGAAALLERGAEGIAPFAPDRPYRVDVPGLVGYATELARRITDDGATELTEVDRRPRLRHASGADATS